jgi:hypothetical protein
VGGLGDPSRWGGGVVGAPARGEERREGVTRCFQFMWINSKVQCVW